LPTIGGYSVCPTLACLVASAANIARTYLTYLTVR